MTEDATAPPMYCAVCNQPYPGPHRPTCSAAPAPVEVDVERLRERLKREAARRNSAYDHYGYGWTPEKVDPEVWAAAAEITALRERVADAENQCGYFRVRFNEQITRAEAAEARLSRLMAAADAMRQQYEMCAGLQGVPLVRLPSATAYDAIRREMGKA
jgi:hypothetical protein